MRSHCARDRPALRLVRAFIAHVARAEQLLNPRVDDLAVAGDQRVADDLVFEVDLDLLVLDQVQQEGGDVLGVHLAGVLRGLGRQIQSGRGSSRRARPPSGPALVNSQLPPRSAARSTITEPGAILATISAVTRTGDFLPGMAAVVITASLLGDDFGHQFALLAVELFAHLLGVAALGLGRAGLQLPSRRTCRRGSAPAP